MATHRRLRRLSTPLGPLDEPVPAHHPAVFFLHRPKLRWSTWRSSVRNTMVSMDGELVSSLSLYSQHHVSARRASRKRPQPWHMIKASSPARRSTLPLHYMPLDSPTTRYKLNVPTVPWVCAVQPSTSISSDSAFRWLSMISRLCTITAHLIRPGSLLQHACQALSHV